MKIILPHIYRLRKLLAGAALLAGLSAVNAQIAVTEIQENTEVPKLIVPQSFETDTHAMLQDWYLRTYTMLDTVADSRIDVEVTDEELTERLSRLPVVIEMPFNSVVKNYIMMYANRRKQLVENMLALGTYYMPIFEAALDRYGLPRELRYIPIIESALRPTAVSPAGAVGLWQFMSPTAGGLGLEINSLVDERIDPLASSDAAARYLKQLYETFGDWSLAIASYNCGPGNVNKALRRVGEGKHDFWDIYPFLPAETRGYFPSFIAATYIMHYYRDHNISPALARRPLITDTVHVTRRVHFAQISEVMDIPMDELRALNPQYRTEMIPGDLRPYPLVLPSLQTLAYIANEDSILNHNADRYARRTVVEPAAEGAVRGSDSRGEYVDELVTQYHRVGRGETLSSIARKYGTTVSAIRKLNKVGKAVKRGTRLKIQTYRRRYIETPAIIEADSLQAGVPVTLPDSIPAPDGDISAPDGTAPDSTATGGSAQVAQAFAQAEQSSAASSQQKKPASQQATRRHTVKKGENLFQIAKRYHTTVNAIKKANNLKSDAISVGQRLRIP